MNNVVSFLKIYLPYVICQSIGPLQKNCAKGLVDLSLVSKLILNFSTILADHVLRGYDIVFEPLKEKKRIYFQRFDLCHERTECRGFREEKQLLLILITFKYYQLTRNYEVLVQSFEIGCSKKLYFARNTNTSPRSKRTFEVIVHNEFS